MLGSLMLTLFSATAAAVSSSGGWVHRLDINGCDPARGWGVTGYAVNPDKQTAALVREERRSVTGDEPPWSDIVYLDLKDGRQIASCALPLTDLPELAISADGNKIIIIHQQVLQNRGPWSISLWKPLSSPQSIKDYKLSLEDKVGPGVISWFDIMPGLQPAISPDGTRVALFGQTSTQHLESPGSSEVQALGVVNLETGSVMSMPLPITFDTDTENNRYWYLAWSADGSAVYAVLHGNYSEERHGKAEAGKPVPSYPHPNLTLYRFSLADRSVTSLGLVPPSTCGFGPDEDLLVVSPGSHDWGPARAFGRVPISEIVRGDLAEAGPAASFGRGLQMQQVTPDSGSTQMFFRRLFVGRSHVLAEVVSKGGCSALVESVAGEPATEEH
jgi:hypothetical protein